MLAEGRLGLDWEDWGLRFGGVGRTGVRLGTLGLDWVDWGLGFVGGGQTGVRLSGLRVGVWWRRVEDGAYQY